MKEYSDAIDKSLESSQERLSESFSKIAKSHGWPDDVINDIKMSVQRGNISMSYDRGWSNVVSDLEYGNLRKPARAAVRNFTATVKDDLADIISEAGIDMLFERGVFE